MIKTNPKTEFDYEIMIVGGGPAGISTWLHLHKYFPELAEKTLLIEKATYPRDKLCGGAIGGWGNVILKQLGIEINVPSLWIDKIECIFENDIIYINEPKFFRMVRRTDFDHELAKVAIKRGLYLNEDEMFLDFKQGSHYLEIKTNLQKYKIKNLVGADGSLSKVRRKMNLNNTSNLAPTIEIFEPVNTKYDKEFEEKKVIFDFSPIKEGLQGYVWHFPCLFNSRPFMNHGIGDFRIFKNRPNTNMKNIFQRELIKRNIHREIKSWSSHPIRWLSKEDILSQSNIILVGDAAGIEPATGGGIHLALSYGELAAETICDAYKLNDFSFKDYKQRLQNHLVGKFIQKLTSIAFKMYSLEINPLDAAKQIFLKR